MVKDQLIGRTREEIRKVSQDDTAKAMGSGDIDVYATPAMVAFMEYTAKELIKPALEEQETTVGVRIDVRHLKPTPVSKEVRAKATITQVEGRKITLKVDVFQGDVLVGTCLHERFVVDKNTFGRN